MSRIVLPSPQGWRANWEFIVIDPPAVPHLGWIEGLHDRIDLICCVLICQEGSGPDRMGHAQPANRARLRMEGHDS